MARPAKNAFTLPDGQQVGYGLLERGGAWRVRFTGPDGSTRIEQSTGCTSKANAYTAAAKIILKTFQPAPAITAKSITWEHALAALPSDLRGRTTETYESTLRLLRDHLPDTKGPAEVTIELAKRFRHEYGSGTYARSTKSDAKRYKRSAKTVENAVRRLSGLWSHLKEAGYAASNPWESVSRPSVPKRLVQVPTEDAVTEFMAYVRGRYPDCPILPLLVTVKALTGCRTSDLCGAKSADLRDGCLTIQPDGDKTNRERVISLPADVFADLERIKGATYLWESYTAGAKVHRPGSRNQDKFKPKTLFWAVNNLFREFNATRPNKPKLLPHAFRRRAITRMVTATQSIDQTAAAIGIDPSTARRYYLDAKQAFDGQELMKRMADVLRPGQGTATT